MKYAVVILAALATAQSAWTAPAPLRVTGISPPVADRGELVTITGGGFGASNLEVSVAGEPVELVAATGSRASFRVPALGAVGDVTVEARNPGGHVGRIGLHVRFDGHTVAVADEAAAVATAVGEEGGAIALEGMELTIPAGAVPEGTTITATPLRSLQGSPFAATPVGVKLEPSGLVLLQPATLTLPRPAGSGAVVGFGFDGDGSELHLVPASVSGNSVQLKVWHFSGAGTLTATLGELATVLDYQTTRAHARAEQRIAAALVDAQLNGSDPAQAIFDALVAWRSSVSNGLQVAWDTARLDFFELGFGEWQAWLAYVQEYRDTLSPAQGATLDAFIRVDTATATAAADDVARRVLARCVGPGVPRSALRDVLRLASAVVLAALPIEQAGDPGERQLPSGGGLARACLDVDLHAFEHAPTFARNRDNRFTARALVSFWDGPDSNTIPLRYRLRDATGGPSTPLASGTGATGSYQDTVTPGTLGSRHYELTADLDTSGGDTVLRAFFDRQTDVIPVHERLDLQARRPGDAAFGDLVGSVAAGGTVLLRIRLAGDDIAAKTITLTHDANGTLPASTTTDAGGEATITYTAPASPQIELVTATITEGAFTSGDAVVITTREPVVVTVTPHFGFVGAGRTLQFSATVTGTTDHRVSWVAGGGSISANGLYTAGTTAGLFTVTAVSLADPQSSGSATVQVVGEDATGTYVGDMCSINGFCNPSSQVGYSCGVPSRVGPGTVCAINTGATGWLFGNVLLPFCVIETTGTITGGTFTGRITFCSGSQVSDRMSAARIEGSITNGRLVFTVFAQYFEDPDAPVERFDGRKA